MEFKLSCVFQLKTRDVTQLTVCTRFALRQFAAVNLAVAKRPIPIACSQGVCLSDLARFIGQTVTYGGKLCPPRNLAVGLGFLMFCHGLFLEGISQYTQGAIQIWLHEKRGS